MHGFNNINESFVVPKFERHLYYSLAWSCNCVCMILFTSLGLTSSWESFGLKEFLPDLIYFISILRHFALVDQGAAPNLVGGIGGFQGISGDFRGLQGDNQGIIRG